MCFLPLQQDFYSKSGHASSENSSQIYGWPLVNGFAMHVGIWQRATETAISATTGALKLVGLYYLFLSSVNIYMHLDILM